MHLMLGSLPEPMDQWMMTTVERPLMTGGGFCVVLMCLVA